MEMRDGTGMVDITRKTPVYRSATATGLIWLKEATLEAILSRQVKKGDVLSAARLAAILAVKETPRLIPMCHNVPITAVDVVFDFRPGGIRTTVTVTSFGMTGVEMEALSGVSAALLNIWDMVKSLEKDRTGNYPSTEIADIRVVEKRKEPI